MHNYAAVDNSAENNFVNETQKITLFMGRTRQKKEDIIILEVI